MCRVDGLFGHGRLEQSVCLQEERSRIYRQCKEAQQQLTIEHGQALAERDKSAAISAASNHVSRHASHDSGDHAEADRTDTVTGAWQQLGRRLADALGSKDSGTRQAQRASDGLRHQQQQQRQKQRAETLRQRDLQLAALGPPPEPPQPPQGVYIYGSVGSGKSRLMDLFYHVVSRYELVPRRRRVHFNAAMLEVNARLHHLESAQRRTGEDTNLGSAAHTHNGQDAAGIANGSLKHIEQPQHTAALLHGEQLAASVESAWARFESQPGHGRMPAAQQSPHTHGGDADSSSGEDAASGNRPMFVPEQSPGLHAAWAFAAGEQWDAVAPSEAALRVSAAQVRPPVLPFRCGGCCGLCSSAVHIPCRI